MKKTNIVKKILLASSVILLGLLFGCSNLADSKIESQNKGSGHIVCGSVNIAGALPSSFAEALKSSSYSARSATTSFDMEKITNPHGDFQIVASTNISASVGADAPNAEGVEVEVQGLVTVDEEGSISYSLDLPCQGLWLIKASLWADIDESDEESTAILLAEDEVNVTETSVITKDLVLKPVFGVNTSGAVTLTVTDGTSDKRLKKVVFRGNKLSDTSNENFFEDERTVLFDEAGKAEINLTGVDSNCYEVNFSFEDAVGNSLYTCKETITVFSGFTTDTWLGEGSYLKKTVSGDIEFIISDDLIDGYGTQVVQASPYVFRNYEGTFYMTEDDSAVSSKNSMTSLNYQDSYCFDANGHYYVFSSSGDIISNNEIVNRKSITLSQTYYSNYYIIDSTKNILYSYYINESQLYLTKYPTMLSEGTESAETTKHCTISLESFSVIVEGEENKSSPWPVKCIVNDDVIYIIARDSGSQTPGSYIYHGTFEDGLAEKSLPASSTVALNFESLEYSDLSITDVIYQDGKIYIVFKDYRNSNYDNEIRSRGGILVYECFTNRISPIIIGWTKGHIFKTDSSNTNLTPIDSIKTGVSFNGYVLYNSASSDYPALYTFNSSKSNGPSYCFYSPYDNLSTYFAGPEKIVAIKPKKLVIFDNGRAFYTDADGVLKSKSVRRIVYIDLESLSILDSVDTDVQNSSSYPNPGSANCFESVPEEATYYYSLNAASFQQITVTTSGSYKPSFINLN